MGLLDDAIREHLELKRSHGAPDDEIARAEQEALGPARRDPSAQPAGAALPELDEVPGEEAEVPAAAEPLPLEEPTAVVPPPPPAGEDIEPLGEELEPLPGEELEPPAAAEPPPAQPPAEPPPPAADLYDEPDEVPREEQLGEQPPPPVEDDPHRARTSILDDPLAEGDEHQDVLEETPDFLQEAPEHDKLWFEQKPPRDFDFD